MRSTYLLTASRLILSIHRYSRPMFIKCIPLLSIVFLPLQVFAATILFLGDSLTSGYGVEAYQTYPAIIRTRLDRDNIAADVINGSVSGSTSAGALSRLKWYSRSRPDVLFLALGANDGLRGLSTEELYSNLSNAIRYARRDGMQVILAGMEVPPNYGDTYAGEFRSVYRNLAKKFDVVTVPFLLTGVAGEPQYNLADGIHPNPDGHRKIADFVYPYILEALGQPQSSVTKVSAEGATK